VTEHITDGTPCWCNPEMTYKDPINGTEVFVHKEIQMNNEEIIKAVKNSLNIYSFTAEALEKLMESIRAEALEQAAKVCEQGTGDAVQTDVLKALWKERERIAEVIRGLK